MWMLLSCFRIFARCKVAVELVGVIRSDYFNEFENVLDEMMIPKHRRQSAGRLFRVYSYSFTISKLVCVAFRFVIVLLLAVRLLFLTGLELTPDK